MATDNASEQHGTDDEELETPWHFKLLLVALVLYLLYRLVQLLVWTYQHFF